MRADLLSGDPGGSLGSLFRNEWAVDGTTLYLEAALDNIRTELAEEYMAGKRRPFVEGEPIGTIRPRRLVIGLPETPAERWRRRQDELLALRQKNNKALRAHLTPVLHSTQKSTTTQGGTDECV